MRALAFSVCLSYVVCVVCVLCVCRMCVVCVADLGLEGITEESFGEHLYTAGLPDPDLIIRTSGEER